MVSPRRRQVIIGGLAAAAAPTAFALRAEESVDLVLSGRVVSNGRPLPGAQVASGSAHTRTDADGRFVLRTSSRRYRVANIEGYVANAHADVDGTWRAAFSLTL